MKKQIITLLIVLLFLINLNSIASAITIEKEITKTTYLEEKSTGNTLYVGGSGPRNYSKIQSAIDNSSEGDTVFVYDDSSPYIEEITIDKSISLIGEDKENTIIKSGKFENVDQNIILKANDIKLTNFNISGGFYYSIKCRSNKTRINDCIVSNTIYIEGNKNEISKNTIHIRKYREKASGITIILGDKNSIIKNIIIGSGIDTSKENRYRCGGIRIESCTNTHIGNNIIKNWPTHGIYILRGYKHLIEENKIYQNNIGIYFSNHMLSLIYEPIPVIKKLIVKDLGSIYRNDIINNICGIKIFHDVSLKYKLNIEENNIFLNSHEDKILVFESHFILSMKNIRLFKWIGNYWGEGVTGPKLINTTFRRVFFYKFYMYFKIPCVQYDWRPAKQPYDIEVYI